MTKDEQIQVIGSNPILGCTVALVLFSLVFAVPLMLFGVLFGNEIAGRAGLGFFILPIASLVLFRVLVIVIKSVVWFLGI